VAVNLPKPKSERISALTALVLLTYGLVRMVVLPTVETEIELLGLLIEIEFKTQSVMLILTAGLAAAGTDWLIQGHPERRLGERLSAENWVIPAMAALAVGVIVIRISEGPPFWIGLLLGAILLVAVFTAEFIVSYVRDPRYEVVANLLVGLALLLLTSALITIYTQQLRALFAIPLIFIASAVVTWRLYRLNLPSIRVWPWAILSSSICSQIAIGLHYWPLQPLRVSLLLGLSLYISYRLIASHLVDKIDTSQLVENAIVGSVALIAILVFT
jgi:hypothetical protein